jgi:hypothetical protein
MMIEDIEIEESLVEDQYSVIGGESIITGGNVDSVISKLKHIYTKSPHSFIEELTDDTCTHQEAKIIANEWLNSPMWILKLVEYFELAKLQQHLFGFLHEGIATAYVKIIKGRLIKQDGNEVGTTGVNNDMFDVKRSDGNGTFIVKLLHETYTANYTENVTYLKNMVFEGWNRNEFKGFCVHEPVVRLKQLMKFPIHKFANVRIKNKKLIDLKKETEEPADEIIEVAVTGNSIKDLYNKIIASESQLIKWEVYYKNICVIFDLLIAELNDFNSQ